MPPKKGRSTKSSSPAPESEQEDTIQVPVTPRATRTSTRKAASIETDVEPPATIRSTKKLTTSKRKRTEESDAEESAVEVEKKSTAPITSVEEDSRIASSVASKPPAIGVAAGRTGKKSIAELLASVEEAAAESSRINEDEDDEDSGEEEDEDDAPQELSTEAARTLAMREEEKLRMASAVEMEKEQQRRERVAARRKAELQAAEQKRKAKKQRADGSSSSAAKEDEDYLPTDVLEAAEADEEQSRMERMLETRNKGFLDRDTMAAASSMRTAKKFSAPSSTQQQGRSAVGFRKNAAFTEFKRDGFRVAVNPAANTTVAKLTVQRAVAAPASNVLVDRARLLYNNRIVREDTPQQGRTKHKAFGSAREQAVAKAAQSTGRRVVPSSKTSGSGAAVNFAVKAPR